MKTALITGASGGIGSSLASLLDSTGWQLSLVSRDVGLLSGLPGHLQSADVSHEQGARDAVGSATLVLGGAPRALLHCAGNSLVAPIGRTTEAQFRSVMAANLDSAFFVAKAYALAVSQAGQGGSLVLFSSVVAGIGVANHAAIAAAKGGVEALTRSLAADFSSIGLRVNCIAPGFTRTGLTERMLVNPAGARQVAAQYPLGRHGEPGDVAALAAFLASDDASWITGQVIALDGGFSSVRPLVRAG